METQLSNGKERIVWLDAARLVAMFMVICSHCTDPFNCAAYGTPEGEAYRLWGAVFGALARICVPMFAMITGALLLPVRQDTCTFYRRRITRVVFPFLIWSVLYCMFPWITGLLGLEPEIITKFFAYAAPVSESTQTLSHTLTCIASIPVNFSIYDVHRWYIYMLIGLYLYMPVFSAWVERAGERAKLTFLTLWGITLFLPYYHTFADQYIWGECSWNGFSTLYYFAGFNGYLLLGHYLRRHDWPAKKTLVFGLPVFAAGYAITFAGFRHMTAIPDATEPMCELFFTFCSVNVAMMAIPAFMLVKKITIRNGTVCRLLANLTLCGFGIYMVHYIFVGPAVMLTRNAGIPIPLQIPIAAVITFAISWIIAATLRKALGRHTRIVIG